MNDNYMLPEEPEVRSDNDFLPETRPTMVPENVAVNKAQRIDFALGVSSPGFESLKTDLINGYEQQTREKMMNLERVNDNRARQQKISSFVDKVRSEGRYIDSQDIAEINKISNPIELEHLLVNPDTYFEKRYAKEMIDLALSPSYPEGIPTEDRYNPLVRATEKYLTKQAGYYDIAMDMQARKANQGFIAGTLDTLETWISFKSWWNTTDAVENAPTSSYLPGSNIEQQIRYLNSIDDPDQAKTEARKAVEAIAEVNLSDAVRFSQYLVSYTDNDELIENSFAALDAAGVVAPAALRGGGAMLRTIAKAGGKPSTTIPGVLDATGQTARSAFSQVQSRFMRKLHESQSGASKDSAQDLMGTLHGFNNPSAVLADRAQTPFSVEFADRLESWLMNITSSMTKAGTLDPFNITRIAPGSNAYRTMMQEAENAFRIQYPEVNDAIVAIRPIRSAENAASNTDHIAVNLGRKTGDLFDADYEAEAMGRLWGLRDFRVVQLGDKYSIEVVKTVDETLPSVRAALAIDVENSTPTSLLNRFMKGVRTRDELVSENIAQDLKAATLGAEQLSKLSQSIMASAFEELPKWRSSSRQDFMSFVTMLRDMPNPTDPSRRGWFPNTIGEFTNEWQTRLGRMPTEQEAKAFFTYKRVNDAEWVLRNTNIYKGKSRLGFERWSLNLDELSVLDIEARLTTTDRMFLPDDDAGILILDRSAAQQHEYIRKNYMAPAARQRIEDLVNNQGYRVIQVSQYGEEAFRNTPGLRNIPQGKLHYMIVKDYKTRPLSLRQIPYRPGGHVEYADKFLIGQEHVVPVAFRGTTIHDYYGDRIMMSASTPEKARQIAEWAEGGRQLLGNNQALDAYLRNNRLPWSVQQFTQMFDASRGGIFNPNIPIRVKTNGSTMLKDHKIDRLYENFRDPFNTPHNAFNEDINLQYALERQEELTTLNELGSATNPFMGRQPSRRIDPLATISRSVNSAARNRYIEDLKIKNAERFVGEFGDMLNGSAEEIQRYPMRAFAEGALNNSHPDKARLAAAKNYQRTMKEFFSIKDPEISRAETLLMNIVDTITPYVGRRRAEPLLDRWVDSWMAHTINDPVKFFRQTSFYAKMGFWNPKQLFLQANGVAYTAAVEGWDNALRGMGAAYLMRPLHMSNGGSHLNHAAKLALSHGYKTEEHFKESYLALQRSGFQNVGGEYGLMDDFLSDRIVRSGAQKVSEAGLMFFRQGERINRLTAWNVAYQTWRRTNPIAVFDDAAAKQVLNRADTLTLNMTRASNAQWNQGFASIPTQFWSYQSRLMDQMLGTRLTRTQKARVLGYHAALYGVPTGVFGTAVGLALPANELGRKYAIESGINMDETGWQLFMNGVPQTLAAMLTGGEGPNISATFGPGGNSLFYDLYRGDTDVVEAIAGPSGKTIANLGSALLDMAAQGLMYDEPTAYSILATGLADDGVHYKVRDKEIMMALNKVLEPISTWSTGQKAFYAYNTGKYLTKHGEKLITDANGWHAFFTGLIGTNPQEISDFYTKIDIKKDIEKFQEQPRREAIKWLRMSMDNNLSFDEQIAYRRNAATFKILGDFTEEQWTAIHREALRNYTTQIEEFDRRLSKQNNEQYQRSLKKILGEK